MLLALFTKRVIPCLFLLLFISSINAQKIPGKSSSRSINIVLENKNISASVTTKKISPQKDRIYYWFDNNSIHTTQGDYSYYLLNGFYSEYAYPGGQLLLKGKYENGLKVGKWTAWNKEGTIQQESAWRKGRMDGAAYWYSSEGKLISAKVYHSGIFSHDIAFADSLRQKGVYGNDESTPKSGLSGFWKKIKKGLGLNKK